MKDTCTWSQNTHGNSWGDINKFKWQLQSNNSVSGLKEILIAAEPFWVPWDATQTLNPLHRAITVALSTVAMKAVSHKINVFYHQKKCSPLSLVQLLFVLLICKQGAGMLKQVLANLDPIFSLLQRDTKAEEQESYFSASERQAHAFSVFLSYTSEKKGKQVGCISFVI